MDGSGCIREANMNAVECTKKQRLASVVFRTGSLPVFLCPARLRVLPFHEILPSPALIVGTIPIAPFMPFSKPIGEPFSGRAHFARPPIRLSAQSGIVRIGTGDPAVRQESTVQKGGRRWMHCG